MLTTLVMLATSVQADSFEAFLTANVLQASGQYASCSPLEDHCTSQGMELANLEQVQEWLQSNTVPCTYDHGNCKAVTSDFYDSEQVYRILYSSNQGSFGHSDHWCANTDRYFLCKSASSQSVSGKYISIVEQQTTLNGNDVTVTFNSEGFAGNSVWLRVTDAPESVKEPNQPDYNRNDFYLGTFENGEMTFTRDLSSVTFDWTQLRVYCANYIPCTTGDVQYETCVYPFDSINEEDISTPTTTATVSGLFTVDGDCEVVGNCVSSLEWPNRHGNNEECTVTAQQSVSLSVSNPFDIETCCDHFTVAGTDVNYASFMPTSMYAGETIFWRTDYSVTDSGWQVCFSNNFSNNDEATQQPTQKECSWTDLYPECYGADIQEVYNVASLEDCQAGCEAHSDCKFITWGRGRCIYKNGAISAHTCLASVYESNPGCDEDGYCMNTGSCDPATAFCGSSYVCRASTPVTQSPTSGPTGVPTSMEPSALPTFAPTFLPTSALPTVAPTTTKPIKDDTTKPVETTAVPESTRVPQDTPPVLVQVSTPSESPTPATAHPSSTPVDDFENNVQYVVEKETVQVHGHVFYLMFLMLFCCLGCGVCALCRPRQKIIHTVTKKIEVKTDSGTFPEIMETAWEHGTVETGTIAPAETKHVVVDFTPAGDMAGEGNVQDNEESEGGLYLEENESVQLYSQIEAIPTTNGSTSNQGLKYVVADEPEGHQQTTSARAQMHRAYELA